MFADLAAAADNMAKVAVVPVAVVSGVWRRQQQRRGRRAGGWRRRQRRRRKRPHRRTRRRRGLQRRRRRWPCTIVIGDRCDATFAQTISPGWYSRPPAHTQGTRYATESTASKTALSAVQSRIQVGMPGTGTTWGPLRMGVGRANLWRALDATPARMPFRPAEHACHPRDAEKRGRSSSHGGPLE